LKYILVLIFLFAPLFSDEIQRIESIVKDITELRIKYDECQKELTEKPKKAKKQEKSNEINLVTKQKIIKLENQIKRYKKLLKLKDKKIKNLEKCTKPKKKKKITTICKPKKLENPNKFPILILKKKYIKYKIRTTKPSTYRLIVKAKIYDFINGKVIDSWENDISFTSNKIATNSKESSWVKITGFFLNGKWIKSQSQMWIESQYINKR